jgi:hypothetical protein
LVDGDGIGLLGRQNQAFPPVSADSGGGRGSVAASIGMGPWFSAGMAPQICFGGQFFFQIASARQAVATRSIRVGVGLLDNGPFGGRERRAAFR